MTRVVITQELDKPEAKEGLASRHPELAYVFGDTIRGFYVVGCLILDLFTPLQVVELLPGQRLWVVPSLIPLFAVLAFLEYRLYRRFWPPRLGRAVVDGRGP